jgi:hypothetical protein
MKQKSSMIAMKTPGEVVTVRIWNANEDHHAKGKGRPGILIIHIDGHWEVMGLTRKPKYQNGATRMPVPNPPRLGLRSPSYFWGSRLTNVSAMDLGDHIGWIDSDTIDAMVRLGVTLEPRVLAALRVSAAKHNPQ